VAAPTLRRDVRVGDGTAPSEEQRFPFPAFPFAALSRLDNPPVAAPLLRDSLVTS